MMLVNAVRVGLLAVLVEPEAVTAVFVPAHPLWQRLRPQDLLAADPAHRNPFADFLVVRAALSKVETKVTGFGCTVAGSDYRAVGPRGRRRQDDQHPHLHESSYEPGWQIDPS